MCIVFISSSGKWPYAAYRHKVSWVADESYKYCSMMEEIIPRQTVHSMYRKNGSVENTYELSSVHNIAYIIRTCNRESVMWAVTCPKNAQRYAEQFHPTCYPQSMPGNNG